MAGLSQEFKKKVLTTITQKKGDIKAAAKALEIPFEQATRIKKLYGKAQSVKPHRSEIVVRERAKGKSIATIAFENDFDIRLVRQYSLNRSPVPVTTTLSMDRDELEALNKKRKRSKGSPRNSRGELAAKRRKLERLLKEVEQLKVEIVELAAQEIGGFHD